MKKALLISMTIFTITTAYSQTGKGNKFIGGRINLYGADNSYSDTTYASASNSFTTYIIPTFGYFIRDNFAVGANLSLGIINSTNSLEYSNQPYKTSNKNNTVSYGIGGFARYYKNITDNFLFFANAGASYAYEIKTSKQTSSISPESDSFKEAQQNTVSVAVSPGLVYFITPKLGIESSFGSLNYTYSSSKNKKPFNKNPGNSSQYGINLNYLAFGLSYYF